MGTVTVRVPDEPERQMEDHDEIDWDELLQARIREELSVRTSSNVERAIAISDRLSREVGPDEDTTTETIREWRDRRGRESG